MGQSKLEVIITGNGSDASDATQELTNKLKGLTGATKEQTSAGEESNKTMESAQEGARGMIEEATGLSLSEFTLAGAMVGVVKVLKESVDEYINATDEMRKLSNLTGDSVEEVSRLGDVAEKTGVDMGTLTMALTAADRKGISPNIEGLEKLSDAYLALAPGVDRAHFLLENFGRGGSDLANIMELGSDGIKKMADETGNMEIVTSAMVEQDKEWKAQTAELSDQMKGPMMQAGYAMVGIMSSVVKTMMDGQLEFKPWVAFVDLATERVSAQRSAERDLESQRLEGLGAMYAEIDAYKSIPTEAGNASASLADYADKMGYAADQTQIFHDRQMYMQDDLKTQQAGLADVTAAFGKLTTQMLYNKAAAGLNEDDAAHLAVSMGLLDSKTYEYLKTTEDLNAQLHAGTIDMDTFTKDMLTLNSVTKDTGTTANKIQLDKMFKDGIISATEYKIKLQELADQINGLTDKTVTVNVDILGADQIDNLTTPKAKKAGHTGSGSYATGGSWTIPKGYENEGYRMPDGRTASTGEGVTISASDKSPADKPGVTLVINNYSAPPDIAQAHALLSALMAVGV